MNVDEWQKRLEDNFTINNVVGGYLLSIIDSERDCENYFAQTFHGQSVLIDSFQSFFIETMSITRANIEIKGWPKNCLSYQLVYIYFIVMFRRFRACENLLLKGYPMDGYSLIRDLKDRSLLMGAVAHNITTLSQVFGYSGTKALTDEIRKAIKRDRKKEEQRVLNLMIRKDSGPPEKILLEINKWEYLFHEEVHGSKLSFYSEIGNLIEGKTEIMMGPNPKEEHMSMYMNRICEIAWIITRLFPYLQDSPQAFGNEWNRRRMILDDSFSIMQKGLDKIGKNIGEAFIYFINNKFNYKDPFYYFEAKGST